MRRGAMPGDKDDGVGTCCHAEDEICSEENCCKELRRLLEEKAVATEVFTQTIERYEMTVSSLELQVRDLRKQVEDLQHGGDGVVQSPGIRSARTCIRVTPPSEQPFIPALRREDSWMRILGLGHNETAAHAAARLPVIHRALHHKCVPARLRTTLWLRCMGNPLQVSPELYVLLLQQLQWIRRGMHATSSKYAVRIGELFESESTTAAEGTNAAVPLPTLVTAFEAIAVDLPRCLSCYSSTSNSRSPALQFLSNNAEEPYDKLRELVKAEEQRVTLLLNNNWQREWLLRRVRELLEMFCVYRPDIGYTQGMDSLAVVIAATEAGTSDEDDFIQSQNSLAAAASFCLFANLACKEPQASFLTLRESALEGYAEVFTQSISEKPGQLLPLLSFSGVPIDSFLVEWLLTLFARALPLHVVPFAWDNIFAFGDRALVKIAVAMVKYWQGSLLDGGSLTEQALREFASEGLRNMSSEQSLQFVHLHLRNDHKSVASRTGKAIMKFISTSVVNPRKVEDKTERQRASLSSVADDENNTPAEVLTPPTKSRSKSFIRLWR